MERVDAWHFFRWIFGAFVVFTAGATPWVASQWPGLFWDYVGLCLLIDVGLLAISISVFGFLSILEPPAEVEADLEEEDDSEPVTPERGEMTSSQLVREFDRVDGNQPPDRSAVGEESRGGPIDERDTSVSPVPVR